MNDVAKWFKSAFMWVGIAWVVCMVSGVIGSAVTGPGRERIVYVPVPAEAMPARTAPKRPPPPEGKWVGGIPMLESVRVIPYDEVQWQEYGIAPRGILPPVCVPQYPACPRRF